MLRKNLLTAIVAFALIALASLSAPVQPKQRPTQEVVSADLDRDGMPDALEKRLLARFTPYLRFSNDGGEEQYRPMDALTYVRWSELQTNGDEGKGIIVSNGKLIVNPESVLGSQTNITTTIEFRHDRFLNPLADVPTSGGNWARHGYSWPDVLASRSIGLYGHVVPFRATPPQTDFLQCSRSHTPSSTNRDSVLCDIDIDPHSAKNYYKVEYWQFFGYNGVGKPFDFGDHEGDWTSVQVIVDSVTLDPVQVHLFAHGYRFGFDLQPGRLRSTVDLNGGAVREYHGQSWPSDVDFYWHKTLIADARNDRSALVSQNNVLRMMRDSATGQYTHPVVYIEHGGHEFWPTERWSYQDSPSHNGNETAHSYLAAPPPNLGEVERPLSEAAGAVIILQYNGRWGAYSRQNDPPQGPALHNGWTWPASSSIRWHLNKDLGN
jgi:hypothetical protein